MLQIHRSERADVLVAALGELLRVPSGDPFAPELVAVPSRGVERWLAQRLSHVLGAGAAGDGVCANVLFPPSGRLLDDALASAHEGYAAGVEAWAPERVQWPLLELLDAEPPRELAAHLAGDPGRRVAVAAKLARLFDAYGRARPEMVVAWRDGAERDDDLAWQPRLWRRLREVLGTPAPAELLDEACSRVGGAELPDRMSVFGVTRVSPARVRAIRAIGAVRDVHLWLHHPSPAMWTGDPPRHPLLASLARDIRAVQTQFAGVESMHHPVPERPPTLLGRLQGDLAADRPPTAAPPDASIRVHACHGPHRQVEVVREVILGLLRDDPTLEPRDIVVLCPDVEIFAPLVAAAFGMADEPGGHPAARLRVRLADRSLRQTNPLLRLLSQVLEIAAHRVTATEVLDLASHPAVRRRFGFSDDDVERLRDWTTATNARWGLDAAHRAPYGLGGVDQGTWRAAVDRLLLGAAMEEGDELVGDTVPLDDVDSAAVDLAGRFAELVDRLDSVVRACAERHTVAGWVRLLADAVDRLGEPLQPWQAIQLRGELEDLADAAGESTATLTRADVAGLLAGRLAGRPTRASFRTGTLTVCTLVPMRSVPHRVVCLLGMDDGAFPRNAIRDGDDLLARDPRPGERDPRSEDRQLFLDALGAARDHLVITYTGADPRTGLPVPPCVPLGELLDAIGASTGDRDAATVHHPLQPFDARNFTGPFSFDPAGLAGARAAARERVAPPPLVAAPLVAREDTEIALDDLVRFLQHPARGFLRQRLQLSTYEADDDPADALPIDIRGLGEWAIGERVLRRCLAGTPPETCVRIEHRRGELPPGRLGTRTLALVGGRVTALLAASESERRLPAEQREIAVELGGRLLLGTVGGVRGSSVVSVSYSRLRARHRLGAWITHLALVASTGDPGWRTVTIGRDRDGAARAVLTGVTPGVAREVLADLIGVRDQGLREPLPMAIDSSAEYAKWRQRNRDAEFAQNRAKTYWDSGTYPGENADREHELLWGTGAPLATLLRDRGGFEPSRFGDLARLVWEPLLQVERLA